MALQPGGRNPYEDVHPDDLGINDMLAADRTALSNERTLLSYVRTALTFAVSGGSAIQFIGGTLVDVVGYALVAAGVATGLIGAWRYRTVSKRVAEVHRSPRTRHHEPEDDDAD